MWTVINISDTVFRWSFSSKQQEAPPPFFFCQVPFVILYLVLSRKSAWTSLGQSWTVGLRPVFELRWALHWHKPIHLESTGTDSEIQASLLRKPFWLTSALPLWKRKVVQEMKSSWWGSWRKGYGGVGPHLCHSWDILSSENEQRPIFDVGDLRVRCIWGCVFIMLILWNNWQMNEKLY